MDEYTQMLEMQLRFAEEEKQQAIRDTYYQTKSEAIKEYVNELKRYMETTEQSDYLDEFNKGNHTYSAMPIYDYADELAEKLIK